MSITNHRLQISEPNISLDFYINKLGMLLISQYKVASKHHYFLAFSEKQDASLELVFDPNTVFTVESQPSLTEGYWKYSIAVPNLVLAREHLILQGINIGSPFAVKNIAYLCHFTDPDGYCIELIQHYLTNNNRKILSRSTSFQECQPTFNLSTLRVKQIDKSLAFYKKLGMSLVSRQKVESRNMHLYFLSFNKESPPSSNIDSVSIREWLWQRPYTLLELQHTDDIESKIGFNYRTSTDSGFLGLDIKNLKNLTQDVAGQESKFLVSSGEVNGIILNDPDGYPLRCY
ncbi:VOC family protein [Thalassotalea piscium]